MGLSIAQMNHPLELEQALSDSNHFKVCTNRIFENTRSKIRAFSILFYPSVSAYHTIKKYSILTCGGPMQDNPKYNTDDPFDPLATYLLAKSIPMTDGFSGVESVLSFSQSKAQHVSHSHSYGFRVATPRCGKGGVLCILKTHPSWV
jgi:hypothetical protein